MLAEGAGVAGEGAGVSREEAAPLVAEAEQLYSDALAQVSDQLGLEHPRTLALKVVLPAACLLPCTSRLALPCACSILMCVRANAGGSRGPAPQSASLQGGPAAV